VSRYLIGGVGTTVHLSQAQGEFCLPDRVPEHVVMISGGPSITPVMSMLRSPQRRTHRGHVTFVHYARSADLAYNTGPLGQQLLSVARKICHFALPDRSRPSGPSKVVDPVEVVTDDRVAA